MVRCGQFDPNDPPTPASAAMAACPICEQKDAKCKACGGAGTFRIESDPATLVPSLAYRVAQFAELYIENGLPLISGGVIDQSSWFASAAAFCVADRKRIIAEQYGTT